MENDRIIELLELVDEFQRTWKQKSTEASLVTRICRSMVTSAKKNEEYDDLHKWRRMQAILERALVNLELFDLFQGQDNSGAMIPAMLLTQVEDADEEDYFEDEDDELDMDPVDVEKLIDDM